MKKTLWQQVMPHLVSIAIFLIIALIFNKPALESDSVMKQGDIINWQGMVHQMDVYKEKHGRFPLWTPNMYAGMPAYQIALEGPWTPLHVLDGLFQLWLPKPINIFFLACVCFYFLCMCLRIRPWVAVIGGLAFAYSTTFPIFIGAGHDTQMLALAYAPAVLGGIILLFDKKYLSGFIATAVFAGLQIIQGHQQVSYYMFLVIGIMSLFFLIQGIRSGNVMQPLKAIGLGIAGCILGVMINAVTLMTVYDYAKQSKRNGQLVMDKKSAANEVISNNKTKGLSKAYAFQWSYGVTESLTLMFPGVSGYGNHGGERDGDSYVFPQLPENSNVAQYTNEKLGWSEDQATRLSGYLYWGDQPFTAGPIYLGAVVCMLFLFSMVYLDGKHKWWILTAGILGVLLALGKHFPALNYFLFDYFPLYNKFRVPTMALEITGLVLPIGLALGLEKLLSDAVIDLKKVKLAGFITAGVFVVAALLYFTMDYSSENKQRTAAITQLISSPTPSRAAYDSINNAYLPMEDNKLFEALILQARAEPAAAKGVLTAMRKDRQSAFGGDIMRSLLFVAIAAGLIFLFVYKRINALVLLAGLGLVTAIDLLTFDSKYLNRFSYGSKESYEASEFPMTAADQAILQDKDPNFRVLNTTASDPYAGDSRTSYYHKSIGGYHPARLGIYDDLIEYQLSGAPNMAVFNMLNTKYFIQQTQQGGVVAVPNPNALGNCWFVKNVQYVNGAAEEMKAISNFNPAETAVVDNTFKSSLEGATPADSLATIKQTAFDDENIKYESNATATHVAVFSEIFYKDWKAYIDGKPAPIAKADYVLRALLIPAGKHSIEFKFEPTVFNTGYTISTIAAGILTLLILGYIFWLVRPLIVKNKK